MHVRHPVERHHADLPASRPLQWQHGSDDVVAEVAIEIHPVSDGEVHRAAHGVTVEVHEPRSRLAITVLHHIGVHGPVGFHCEPAIGSGDPGVGT